MKIYQLWSIEEGGPEFQGKYVRIQDALLTARDIGFDLWWVQENDVTDDPEPCDPEDRLVQKYTETCEFDPEFIARLRR